MLISQLFNNIKISFVFQIYFLSKIYSVGLKMKRYWLKPIFSVNIFLELLKNWLKNDKLKCPVQCQKVIRNIF